MKNSKSFKIVMGFKVLLFVSITSFICYNFVKESNRQAALLEKFEAHKRSKEKMKVDAVVKYNDFARDNGLDFSFSYKSDTLLVISEGDESNFLNITDETGLDSLGFKAVKVIGG